MQFQFYIFELILENLFKYKFSNMKCCYLASLNEFMILNICFHGTSALNKMIISAINFKLSPWSSSVWYARTKSIWILGNQLIINTILKRAYEIKSRLESSINSFSLYI